MTREEGQQKQNGSHLNPGMFSSLSEAVLGWVQGQMDRAPERNLPRSSHLQLYTFTEGRPCQSSRWCLHQMAGTAWQHAHADGSSMPVAVCSTWRQIKPAWCWATTLNMPGQERQREVHYNRAVAWLRLWVLGKSRWGLYLPPIQREPYFHLKQSLLSP